MSAGRPASVPRGGDAAGIVTRMWGELPIVVRHRAEPEQAEGICLSVRALRRPGGLERPCAGLARQPTVRVRPATTGRAERA